MAYRKSHHYTLKIINTKNAPKGVKPDWIIPSGLSLVSLLDFAFSPGITVADALVASLACKGIDFVWLWFILVSDCRDDSGLTAD
jgi:hypothetical protein